MTTKFLAAITLVLALGYSGGALAQTTLGPLNLDAEDVPAAAAYCNALVAQQEGDETTVTEDAAAAAPETITDEAAEGAEAGDAGAAAGPDFSAVTVEQCEAAGLLGQ